MIRIAEVSDLPELFKMVDDYGGKVPIDATRTKNGLRDVLYGKGIFLCVHGLDSVGGIAGYRLPCLFNDDTLFAVMVFYFPQQHRWMARGFLQEFEQLMAGVGVNKIVFGVPSVAEYYKQMRFMRMMGYKELEVHMQKDLSRGY